MSGHVHKERDGAGVGKTGQHTQRNQRQRGAEQLRRQVSHLLVLADALFEEVGLALQRNHLHPLERVRGAVDLNTSNKNTKKHTKSGSVVSCESHG